MSTRNENELTTPLPDVMYDEYGKDPKHVYYNAILWGSQKGITKGSTSGPKKGNFGINDNCTRGQIVTFLYRANKESSNSEYVENNILI